MGLGAEDGGGGAHPGLLVLGGDEEIVECLDDVAGSNGFASRRRTRCQATLTFSDRVTAVRTKTDLLHPVGVPERVQDVVAGHAGHHQIEDDRVVLGQGQLDAGTPSSATTVS